MSRHVGADEDMIGVGWINRNRADRAARREGTGAHTRRTLTDGFAWLVDVFTATKAIAAAAMKSAPAMAMRGLRIEVVLDFILPPLMCGLGAEGPVQSNHCERTGRRVRLSGITLHLKRLVSRQIVLWMPCQTALSRQRASAACLATLLSVFVDRKLKFGVVSSAQRGRNPAMSFTCHLRLFPCSPSCRRRVVSLLRI